jgi:hypothetical protein
MLHLAGCNVDDLRNRFGIERAGTLHVHWPARPVLVGRWGQAKPAESGQTANRLSDLVLAAEQPLGQGRIFVLAGTSPLANETLTNAYPFVGRLLVYLANPSSMPQAGWRQLLGIVGIAAMIGFLAWRPAAWPIGLTSVVLSASLIGCIAKSETACRVLPDGRPHTPNNIAYIDASHLEAYSTDLWSRRGIAGFLRTLMRHGYLPLLLPEVTQERLERAGLLISIAPSREFSPDERAAVRAFVNRGGTFFCMVGGEEAGVLGPFLRQEFDLAVPVSPVGPTESAIEPKPIGGFKQVFSDLGGKRQYVQFHAGWPVECDEKQATPLVYWSDGTTNLPIVVYQPEQRGAVVVIGDTYFATNENLEMQDGPASGNVHFWRWLISRTVGGQTAWEPPADLPEDRSPTDDESNDE